MKKQLREFVYDESATVAIEYAFILTLISIGIIGSLLSMGGSVSKYLNEALAGMSR